MVCFSTFLERLIGRRGLAFKRRFLMGFDATCMDFDGFLMDF